MPRPAIRSDEIHPGDLIAGKYRVRTILGRSHGLLVEAFHTEFDQRVVIKILLPGAGDEKEIERFRREARTLAKLESEHVARIIDVGNQQDGSFYLVRQFLEGTDLATHLRQTGALRLQDAVLLILQAAEAVAETHGHGIILRELQPAHLFLTQRVGGAPLVKIIDFGTAKLMRDAAAPTAGGELTATTMFGLSPYSSPELVRKAKNVDARTDVWSLGAILYELLTAAPPFHGEMAMLMLQITKEEPVPVSQLRRDLPAELDPIIGWALAKDLDGRFANVYAFAHALAPYASAEGQVLIERIGQITTAAKQKKRSGSVPPPAPSQPQRALPPIRPPGGSRPPIANEDSVTNLKRPGSEPPPPMEQTMMIGDHYAAAVPPPAPSSRGSSPGFVPPSAPGPMFGGAAEGLAVTPAPVSQPGGSLLGPSPQYDAPRPPAFKPMAAAAPPSAVATGAHQPVSVATHKPPVDKRIVLGALGGAAAILTVLFVVLLMRQRGGAADATATADSAIAVVPPAAAATSAAAATEVASAEPPPSAVPSTTAVAVATTAVPVAPPPATVAAAPPPPSTRGGAGTAPSPKKPDPPPPPPPPASTPASGGTGMLVAVAVGGSCAFAVNGASKGTTSPLKIPLKPGSYSVSCKPASGATKSRSVTIKSGETAMAMFKLQ